MQITETDAVSQAYERDGVVRLKQVLDAEALKRVFDELDRYAREVLPTLAESEVIYESDGQSIRNLWRLDEHDAFFAELAKRPDVVALVRQLVKGEPELRGMETFSKPARVGSGVPPHQDNAYFCQSPPDVLTVWIALDPVTDANGPVFYVPGSHRDGMRPHKPSGVKGNSIGLAEPFDKSAPFVGTLEPGDALIHHCQTIHYSAPNRTDQPRRALLMVFGGAHTQSDPTLKAAYEQARSMVEQS